MNDCIDALPIMAVMACYAKGSSRLTDAAIARYKESNRIKVMVEELQKMGAQVQETADGLAIEPVPLKGAVLEGHHDHRIVMALAVAALGAQGPSQIRNVDCVAKSFADFDKVMGPCIQCQMS